MNMSNRKNEITDEVYIEILKWLIHDHSAEICVHNNNFINKEKGIKDLLYDDPTGLIENLEIDTIWYEED